MASEGLPCVAQRVCPMPSFPGMRGRRFSSSDILPAAFELASSLSMTDTPAES